MSEEVSSFRRRIVAHLLQLEKITCRGFSSDSFASTLMDDEIRRHNGALVSNRQAERAPGLELTVARSRLHDPLA